VLGASIVVLGTAAALGVRRADEDRGRFALFAFGLYLSAVLSPLGWNTNLVAALPLTWALAGTATGAATRALRRGAWALAAAVALLNCVDLLLLPLHLWEDTAKTLLWARQYGIAGLLLAAGAMTGLSVAARRSPERSLGELDLRPGQSPATG
jgi:hypothetical protein